MTGLPTAPLAQLAEQLTLKPVKHAHCLVFSQACNHRCVKADSFLIKGDHRAIRITADALASDGHQTREGKCGSEAVQDSTVC
jgi:hypothetical protein